MSAYSQKDYEAIEAAVQESPRGRWFLDEFIRRNRAAETYTLLEAIRKLERGVVENSALGNSPDRLSDDLAAGLQGLAETIDSTLAGITQTEDYGEATDEALVGQVRKTMEQLSAVRRQIRGLLAARSEEPDDGPVLTEENLKYFEGNEDLFEPPQAAAPPSLVLVGEEKAAPAADAAPQAAQDRPRPKPDLEGDPKGDPKDRIVFIRRGSSKETTIPLADEAEEQPAGHSQPGS